MNRPSFIYSAYLATAAASASDTASGYDAAYVLEACEDTGWRPVDTTGSKTLTIALGASVPVGQVALLGACLNGVVWEVRGSTDGFVASDVQLSSPAVMSTGTFIAAYRQFAEGAYSHVRHIFSGMGASFEIMHVATCRSVTLPWLADGHDPDAFQAEGTHLVGVAGSYLGATQQRCMKTINLDFGQITSTEYVTLQLWGESCISTMRPYFYVPDTSQPECWFGWTEAKYKFSVPWKSGVRKLAAIPFTARLA